MRDHPDDGSMAGGSAADGHDEAAAIAIRLDALLAERQMTLTELSDRVGVTIVNLSVLKNGRARARARGRWASRAVTANSRAVLSTEGRGVLAWTDEPAGRLARTTCPPRRVAESEGAFATGRGDTVPGPAEP